MNSIFKTILFVVFIIILHSCNNNKIIKITCYKTYDVNLQMPFSMAYNDSVLIISDFFDKSGMIKLFDVKSGGEIGQVAPKGGSRNEVLEVTDFEIVTKNNEDYIVLYDLEKGRIMEYSINEIIKTGKGNPSVSIIKTLNRYYAMRKLKEGYVALGMFENYKFELLDDSLNTVSIYGDYLHNKNGIENKRINASANFGCSEVSPDKSLLVNIAYSAGITRFYEAEGNKLSHKKDYIVSPMNYKTKGNGFENLGVMGFLSIAISNTYIYVLYSGEKDNTNNPITLGRFVYKFDYFGNLVNIYELDKPTHVIAVDKDYNNLYTLVDSNAGYKIYCYHF